MRPEAEFPEPGGDRPPTPTDLLHSLRRETVDGTTFFVDAERPVAALDDGGGADGGAGTGLRFVAWADAPQPIIALSARLIPVPNGVWVIYQVTDPGLLRPPPDIGAVSAVRIGVDGSVDWIDVGAGRVVGAEDRTLWIDERRSGAARDEDEWTTPWDITLKSVDGSTRTLGWDRPIMMVRAVGGASADAVSDGGLEVLFERSAPIMVVSNVDGLGSTGFMPVRMMVRTPGGSGLMPIPNSFWPKKRQSDVVLVRLPSSERLPARIGFDDLDPSDVTEVTEANMAEVLDIANRSRQQPPAPDIDLSGVPGSRWPLVDLPAETIDAAVTAGRRLFEPLVTPDGSQGTGFGSHSITNAVVRAVGDWPRTIIEVVFAHPHVTDALGPDARMRRRVRVFDDAGRVQLSEYADVHLWEDLATKLPPIDQAVGGVLDI
ncbi:hypothetical protein [Plantibacter sp. YIM 135347]|uniref:hypothetical protein n=1 Tax=Plantibacter sp. YIM 135347 TaxID=3423919 RepID=UPI003D33A52D